MNDKDVLSKSTALHLMEDLNIAPFINGSLCRRKVATFEQSNDGWINGNVEYIWLKSAVCVVYQN